MMRLVPVIVLLLLLLLPAASVLAEDLPQVLQPNTAAYSASEVAALTQAIATLSDALNNFDMASRRYFSAGDWSSRDFAMYTAGMLSEKGYETLLVSGTGWPDGTHTWVLVGIPLEGKTAWVPVEASPDQGHSQQILGSIPTTTDDSGKMWFDAPYLTFTTLLQLPSNTAPVAVIRPPMPPITTDISLTFKAISSYDPDGEIVLYLWDFGDGATEVATSWNIYHEFRRNGSFVVALTVIDNLGKKASDEMRLSVAEKTEEAPTPPSSGCGCGG